MKKFMSFKGLAALLGLALLGGQIQARGGGSAMAAGLFGGTLGYSLGAINQHNDCSSRRYRQDREYQLEAENQRLMDKIDRLEEKNDRLREEMHTSKQK